MPGPGNRIPTFGDGGIVDLKLFDDQEIDLTTGEIGLHAAPVVADDVVIVGAAHRPSGAPKTMRNVRGYVRAFDVRTGKRLWIFHTIPLANEFGYDTWEKDSASITGNTGVWGQISVDEQLGMAYIPAIFMAGIGPGMASLARRCWRWTCVRVSASGITNWCTTASGTWIFRARRCSSTSPSTRASQSRGTTE
jgi:PQQ enzyme repeat